MYREHLQDPETSKMPTRQTLYDLRCSQPEGEAVRLATALEIYVSGSLNAVSYTHLDVYKRQVAVCAGAGQRQHQNIIFYAVDKQPVRENMTCLLYTSRCV